VVIIATCDRHDSGSCSLRKERRQHPGFKQQSALVIAVASEGDEELRVWPITQFCSPGSGASAAASRNCPFAVVRYYMTVKKGLDVDRPRNLVKSVPWSNPHLLTFPVAPASYGGANILNPDHRPTI